MTGQHAITHPHRKWVIFFVALALAAVPWFLGGDRAGAAPADRAAGSVSAGTRSAVAAIVPSEDACATQIKSAPKGDCGPFDLLYRETFSTNVPLGTFSDCGGDNDHRCEGAAGTRYYNTLGAYPDGWPDTATSGADGNSGRTFGGYYRPQDTTSVIRSLDGKDGKLRVHMWRPSAGGPNHVAAPVPLKCMNLRYGKFTERTAVWSPTNGYKMAHLHYSPDEIDYPEAGGNFATDPVYAYTHGFASTSTYVAPQSAWKQYHTYSTEITPGKVKIFYDGKLIRTINGDYPRATPWVLQNESALAGGYAAKGSYSNVDTTWLNCYAYRP